VSFQTSLTHPEGKLARSVDEAARLIGVSSRFLRKQIKLGNLPALKRGKRVLIRTDDLDDYLRDH
jgi:excisionase family DNA binding protein